MANRRAGRKGKKAAGRRSGRTDPRAPQRLPSPPRRARTWAFRLTAALLAPCVFLLLVEGVLAVSGYGRPTAFLARRSDGEAYTGNQKFGWRFFPPAMARTPVPFCFPARKAKGTCRVFVLGGSAAAGTPDPAYGFPRLLSAMLQHRDPAARFEVVNAAMTAVNSHAARLIARDLAAAEGDLFVVYLGNNEVVGPYGPGTVFAGYCSVDFDSSDTCAFADLSMEGTRMCPGTQPWRDYDAEEEIRCPTHG